MKEETKIWLDYANENLESAKVLFASHLYNPCLQNIQQAIEKYLKVIFIENSIQLKRTHKIFELISKLKESDILIEINEDEIDLIDSIYLPSKYPVGGALPDFMPDENICKKCIEISQRVRVSAYNYLKTKNIKIKYK